MRWWVQSLDLFRLMAPYLMLGFTLAGILHVIVPKAWVARHLGGSGFRASVKAAVLGTPLPLCSCGVVPFADLLKRRGASRSAITSFLISTPQTGVDSILASYAILGLPLTLWKVLTALVSGVLGGTLAARAGGREGPYREALEPRQPAEEQLLHEQPLHEQLLHEQPLHEQPLCERARYEQSRQPSPAAAVPAPAVRRRSGVARFAGGVSEALRYGWGLLIKDIALWLLLGTLAGGAIAAFVPETLLTRDFANPYLQMLAVLALSVPLYVCATGSLPVAAALVMKGMPLGAAIVFLVAGPATNVATLAIFTRVLGKRIVVIYLGTIVVASLFFGALFHILFPGAGLPIALGDGHHHAGLEGVSPLEWGTSLVLLALLVRGLGAKWAERRRERAVRARFQHEKGGTMHQIDLEVRGMSCNHCRGSVEQALRGVPGVQEVLVSLEEGRARVSGRGLDESRLLRAVRESGFEAALARGSAG